MSSLAGRHVVSIFDLTNEEIGGVFRLADRFYSALQEAGALAIGRRQRRGRPAKRESGPASLSRVCPDRVLATLFFEPSTRTRLSFESAMHRLGGSVVTMADARTSSAAKGERLADTVRVVASYADAIVLRHPHEGAALLAAESLDPQRVAELGRLVPIINGGDGSHEHPTQTLLDLYTINRDHGRIAGLNVALCGDLLHARTVHSLAYGLARFGADLKCVSPPQLRLPRYVKRRLELEFGCVPAEYDSFRDFAAPGREHVIYAAEKRRRGRIGPLVSDDELPEAVSSLVDAVYVTRIQKERFREPAQAEAVRSSYLIDDKMLAAIGKHATIMHPLPRVDEVDYVVDTDTRAAYFRQASYGVPIRMALIALLLGRKRLGRPKGAAAAAVQSARRPAAEFVAGVRCENATCVTNHEPGLAARMEVISELGVLRCAYCEQEQEA